MTDVPSTETDQHGTDTNGHGPTKTQDPDHGE